MAVPTYVTNVQLATLYFDTRRVCELASFDGVPAASDPTSLAANAVLAEHVKAASAQVEAACYVGERYLPADLALLAADGTGADGRQLNGALLRKLTAVLAFAGLVGTRGLSDAEEKALAAQKEWAEAQLELLRSGERVFDTDGQKAAAAGLPEAVALGTNVPAGTAVSQAVRLWGCLGSNAGQLRNRPGCGC